MDSERRNSFGSKESIESQRRNSRDNTEYVPTRCRITKPIPPKPATNPMQFVKIGPCELYRKAQEQLKKVEEVKSVRQEIRDEAEDWQANLDNWKSSRRKRQEHIIERVVEVKKFEQQEMEKGRRKSKTFNEILEERNKRKNTLILSVYDDDPNDLSDYGIGVSKNLNETNKNDIDNADELSANINDNKTEETIEISIKMQSEQNDNLLMLHDVSDEISLNKSLENTHSQSETEQYTYESAIQDYRTRVISKTNLNPALSFRSSHNNNTENKTENLSNIDNDPIVAKGNILKRKELFENDKLYELKHFESTTCRRLSEDFAHSQSLKERLMSLEKYSDQPLRHSDCAATDNSDVKNNNSKPDQFVRNRVTVINSLSDVGSSSNEYEDNTKSKTVICNNWSNKRFSSPEPEVFVNKLENKQIHRSLDNLTDTTNESLPLDRVQSLDGLEYCHSNYPASNSSTELLAYGDTDREDSGIHTADVSCSVSQADEPVDDVTTEDDNKCTLSDNRMYPITVVPFDGVFASEDFPLGPSVTALEPPKEKPPPPPVSEIENLDLSDESELKRLNSTKRIKKEIRMKRSSFLGIDPDPDDQPELEASIRKPPDINSFLQRESRLEKQLYKKSQSQIQSQPQTPTQSNYSEAGDSQDSGVELERGRLSSDTWCSSLVHIHSHSRQNSEPCTTNSVTSDEDEITKKEREIIELVEKEEKWRDTNDFSCPSHIQKKQVEADYVTSEDDEHSEVLRVEHELLQLEREELERQRENMMFRESQVRLQSKMGLKNKRLSLEDISGVSNQQNSYMYPSKSNNIDYRKSMPELQRAGTRPNVTSRTPVREPYDNEFYQSTSKSALPMTRHSLQMLSAAPRSRLIPQDTWIQPQSKEKFNYNQHWLIQEAEQRRLSEQQKVAIPPQPAQNWKQNRPEKHLPDSIIHTLTQRVQNKMNIADRNILSRNVNIPHSPHAVGHALPIHHPHFVMEESQDKMLSVSGKKKCSYCGHELGRGAAMIIESLCLFYHMDCFKCCVCHVQLGDGLMGTDVRVRNNKLHCHNCYSSDDGVKFSCV